MQTELDPLLRISAVSALTGLGSSAIYQGMKNGTFPRRVRISARCVAWKQSDVRAWIESRRDAGSGTPAEPR